MRGIALVLFAAAAVVAPALAAPAEKPKVAVFVFTAPAPTRFVTIEQKGRDEAMQELVRDLRGKGRLTIVNDRDHADVVVEVLSATQLFLPGKAAEKPFDENALYAQVTAAGQTERLSESRNRPERTVSKLADRIDKWIERNRDRILAARKKG